MAVFDEVKAIIVEELGVSADEVKMESRFIEDLNTDSLDFVELTLALEEKLKVEIPDEVAEKMSTVGDVVKYIEEQK
ncbi:acyl carrier protein [Helicobacter enhydrae]|uniref:Acyl carrier protein n=1 Tax=Helicobacter enhydrae TaxID=222136 RepID=A0A1B1U769_9HELI|nr:acyl carrier protein [Helicobacter enhydrae]ANV98586.1 acyl carrier protein [Helicobacter enhydrae]